MCSVSKFVIGLLLHYGWCGSQIVLAVHHHSIAGFIWLKLEPCEGVWTFMFCKRQGISWPAQPLSSAPRSWQCSSHLHSLQHWGLYESPWLLWCWHGYRMCLTLGCCPWDLSSHRKINVSDEVLHICVCVHCNRHVDTCALLCSCWLPCCLYQPHYTSVPSGFFFCVFYRHIVFLVEVQSRTCVGPLI